MKVLNAHLNPRIQCVPLRSDETPELQYIKVQDGLEFAFDPNSMALVQVDGVDEFVKLRNESPSPYIMAKYKPKFQKAEGVPKVKSLVLEACHDCNLACSYCFVRNYYADHGTGNYMSFKTAKRAILQLLDPRQNLSVGFFGGEPLLNMSLIKDVTEFVEGLAKKHGPVCKKCGGGGQFHGDKCGGCRGLGHRPPSLHVTTNGALYSEDNLRFLEEHGFSLITSIDGTAEAHDALRPMKRSGKGSHRQIMNGLARMKNVAPRLCSRNTLRSTFSAMRGETIRQRLEFLNQICDDGMGNWVSVEPAAMSENTCFIPNQDELEIHIGNVWNRFYEEYMDTAVWWRERALEGKQPRFHNIHKSLERIFWCVHSGTECGAGVGYASVNAKGEIFGCHRESNSYLGTLVTGIDPKLQQPWLDNRIYTRTGCMNCGHRYACFSGDTKVSLLDGSEKSFADLAGKGTFDFYSFDHDSRSIVPTKGDVLLTGRNRKLLEVELDNGEKLRVTPDHEWLLRDGSYTQTDQLQPGESLMPLYRRRSDRSRDGDVDGYEQFWQPESQEWEFTHRAVSDTIELGAIYDSVNKSLILCERRAGQKTRHHLNHNPLDNRPENLVWMTWQDHSSYHSDFAAAGWSDSRREALSKQQRMLASQGRHAFQVITDKMLDARRVNAAETAARLLAEGRHPFIQWTQTEEHRQRSREQITKLNKTAASRKRSGDKLREWNAANHDRINRTPVECPDCCRMIGNRAALGKHRKSCKGVPANNHKVVAVRPVPGFHDVYCARIQHDSHNFALTAGVFVHNCGGGCREDSIGDKGDIHEPSNVHCALKEMWVRSAMKVMAETPKEVIMKFCREPGAMQNRRLYNYISPDQLEVDPMGIVKPQWVENIPKIALVKEGAEEVKGLPVSDEPRDAYAVDTAFNPAGPEAIPDGVLAALR